MLSLVVNGSPHVCRSAAATIADLVRELDLGGKRIAVERNGEIVGSFFAKVTIGGKSVKLIDDSDSPASDIRSVLKERGEAVIVIGAHDVEAGLAAIAAVVG